MTDQLDVLDSNKLETYVTYDGLRQVENLPKNIHRSNDELYLPPIFAERKSQAGLRMGVQVTSEINQKLPAISINKGGFNAQRSSLDNLYKNNLKVGQLNKLSHFEEVRNRYYKKPENERSQSRPLVYKPQYTPSRYNQSSRSNSGISQKYHPYSAYTSVRPPANRYFSGSLPKRQHEGSSYRSPIITRPDSGSLNKQFTPITNEDFTIEALQQKKMALDRLNDRMKNL